jgi:hypothetical protein
LEESDATWLENAHVVLGLLSQTPIIEGNLERKGGHLFQG